MQRLLQIPTVFLVLFLPRIAGAQSVDGEPEQVPLIPSAADSVQYLPEWHDMITRIPSDVAGFSALTFRADALPAIAGLTLITGAFAASDNVTWELTRHGFEKNRFVHSIADVFVSVGDGTYHFGLAAGFAAYGFMADDRRALRTASQTAEAVLACALVVQVLKHVTGRESPIVTTSKTGTWRFFPSLKDYHGNESKYYAFPSGHIATGMATLTVLIENYSEATWMKPVGYTTIGLIGFGLVARGYHWYSDLPLGIALGYAFGKFAAHPDGVASGHGPRLSFAPVVNTRGGGIGVAYSF